jgi:hypothetical protein
VRATVLSMTGQGNALGQVLGGPLVGWIGTGSLRSALVLAGLFILPNSFLYSKGMPTNTPVEEESLAGEEGLQSDGD